MELKVRVIAGANKRRIVEEEGNSIRVYVKSPPVHGKANEEVVGVLARHFNVGKSDIDIVRGVHSGNKVIRIKGI